MEPTERITVAILAFFVVGVLLGAAALWALTREARVAFKRELGQKVRDKITGYEGIIIARTERLYGTRTYTVQAPRVTPTGATYLPLIADEDRWEPLKGMEADAL